MDSISNDFGREPSNGLTIGKILFIIFLVIIFTFVFSVIIYYIYKLYIRSKYII